MQSITDYQYFWIIPVEKRKTQAVIVFTNFVFLAFSGATEMEHLAKMGLIPKSF